MPAVAPDGPLHTDLTGAGVWVGVWDTDFVAPHPEFGPTDAAGYNLRVGYTANPRRTLFQNSHATYVAGTIAALGNNPTPEAGRTRTSARGFATGVQIISHVVSDAADTAADIQVLSGYSALLSVVNHSYSHFALVGWDKLDIDPSAAVNEQWVYFGGAQDGGEYVQYWQYNTAAAQWDVFLAANPQLVSVWAAGNERDDAPFLPTGSVYYVPNGASFQAVTVTTGNPAPPPDYTGAGYDTLTPEATIKNALVVGAVLPDGLGGFVSAPFSSYGPTDDGRLGVDVVAVGSVYSTAIGGYDTVFGTSAAAPAVSGVAALLVQQYRELSARLPAEATGNCGYADPTAAVVRGLITHAARDLGPAGLDYATGWGLVGAAAAAKLLQSAASAAPTDRLVQDRFDAAPGDRAYRVSAAAGQELRVTLSWTDPAGTATADHDSTAPTLVHDLDVWVEGPDGTVYRP